MLGLAAHEASLTEAQRRRRVEASSAWLRLIVLAILAVNLALSPRHGSFLVHANVVVGYGLATALALALAGMRRGPMERRRRAGRRYGSPADCLSALACWRCRIGRKSAQV